MRGETAQRNPPVEVTGVWPFGVTPRLQLLVTSGLEGLGGSEGSGRGSGPSWGSFKTDFLCDCAM